MPEFEKAYGFGSYEIRLPERKTKKSAGYDIEALQSCVIRPRSTGLVVTGLTVKLNDDEFLELKSRSGLALNHGIIVGAGVIDADYYPNPIGVIIHNFSDSVFSISAGDRVAQGIFRRYIITNDDAANGERFGGFGHTGIGSKQEESK